MADKNKIKAQGTPPSKPGREPARGDTPSRADRQAGNAG